MQLVFDRTVFDQYYRRLDRAPTGSADRFRGAVAIGPERYRTFVRNPYARDPGGVGMADGRLDFEPGTMSPVVPIVTALLIALFVIGLGYRLIGVAL